MRKLSVWMYVVVFAAGMQFAAFAEESATADDANAYVFSLKTICKTQEYCGWPTVTKARGGTLFAVYSGGRQWHVCPFGRIEIIHSSDNGKTWSAPRVLIDTILDDRDTGIVETQKGTLLVTWFTSSYWIDWWKKNLRDTQDPNEQKKWQEMLDEIESGNYRYESIRDEVRDAFETEPYQVDQWLLRSEDGGRTWSQPYRVPLMSPHGSIVCSGGGLLLAGKDPDSKVVGVYESRDDGLTWQRLGDIVPMEGHESLKYHELHIAEAADGRLVVHIRNHNEPYFHETLQSESKDGGRTWSRPHSIGVFGFPSHLIRLKDDTLLMTYGNRRDLRVEARISRDSGATWSKKMRVAGKLHTWDFGYPSTAKLDDGRLVTIWYEVLPDSHNAVIRQAIWKID